MNKLVSVFCACIVISLPGIGETNSHSLMLKDASVKPVTGNLRVDLFARASLADVPEISPQEELAVHQHKSPYLAVGLSLAVPGAGQFYTEHYWEAAAFLAADVAAWVLAYHYDKKGDNQTDFFQNYADTNWDVRRYAQYALDNLVPANRKDYYQTSLFIPSSGPPWKQVNWGVLNSMEREISQTDAGSYYSHTLPLHGDQQYYELIGKYGQFNQGWDDAPSVYLYLDPVTPHFTYYSKERGKANDFYNTASTWVTVAIVNHVVNAVYAGLSAGWYNSAHAELGLQRMPSEYGFTNVPVLKMTFGL